MTDLVLKQKPEKIDVSNHVKKLIGNWLLIEPLISEMVEEMGGLVVPGNAQFEKNPNRGRILGIGTTVNLEECPVEKGDIVIYHSTSQDGGLPAIMIRGNKFAICYPGNIVAVVTE